MSEFNPTNPKPFLNQLIDSYIIVTLKFSQTRYKGKLVSTDNYFNVQLTEAEEIINGVSKGVLGDIFIRCNNILWIGKDPNFKTK